MSISLATKGMIREPCGGSFTPLSDNLSGTLVETTLQAEMPDETPIPPFPPSDLVGVIED